MPILVCLPQKIERFPDFRGTKLDFLRKDVFLKGLLFSKSTLNLERFDTKFVGI